MMLLAVGPRRHGVVDFGLRLADALRHNDTQFQPVHVPSVEELPSEWGTAGVHLQFTDRVFGPSPAAAAEAVQAVVADAAARGGRVTATLHDVPQPSDGAHFARRVNAYASVCDALHGVVVNSDHERLLLCESGITPQRIEIVHLPMRAEPIVAPAASATPSVGIFGFLYPGKGHLEIMAALRGVDPSLAVVAIGEPSAGHDDLVETLQDMAVQQDRGFTVTGYVPDDRLLGVLRDVTVPVAHHRHVSASGSLNTWIAAGRRPLAPLNRYTAEMSERNPDAFLLYPDDDAELRRAICRVLDEPGLTWLAPGTVVTPTQAEAAEQYGALLRRWHA